MLLPLFTYSILRIHSSFFSKGLYNKINRPPVIKKIAGSHEIQNCIVINVFVLCATSDTYPEMLRIVDVNHGPIAEPIFIAKVLPTAVIKPVARMPFFHSP